MKKLIIAVLEKLPDLAITLVYLQNLFLDDRDDWAWAEAEALGFLHGGHWPFRLADRKTERLLAFVAGLFKSRDKGAKESAPAAHIPGKEATYGHRL